MENDAEGMRQALEVILDKRNHPLLIHSNKGKHRAGVLTACVRKLLMGWSLAATFAEYGRYAGEKGEADLEVSFFFYFFCWKKNIMQDHWTNLLPTTK